MKDASDFLKKLSKAVGVDLNDALDKAEGEAFHGPPNMERAKKSMGVLLKDVNNNLVRTSKMVKTAEMNCREAGEFLEAECGDAPMFDHMAEHTLSLLCATDWTTAKTLWHLLTLAASFADIGKVVLENHERLKEIDRKLNAIRAENTQTTTAN